MTKRDINLFSLVLVGGCIVLLFIQDVYTYPHQEFKFPQSFENTRSNDDRSIQSGIQITTTSTSNRENQLSISNINHKNGTNTNLRSRTSQDDIGPLIGETYQNGELLSINKWPDQNNNNGWDRNVQNDTSRYHNLHTRNVSLASLNFTETQIGQRRLIDQQQNNVEASTMAQIDAKFVFPTEGIPTSKPNKIPLGPVPICHGLTFCERASYYPEEIINEAIQQNDSIKYLATEDTLPSLVERIDATDDTPLCVSHEKVIFPQSAESKNKEWFFVVNQDNFKQGVRIETCNNENHSCSIGDNLPEGYKTMCKQKFIYRQLAAISDNGEINPEMFRFPSSCCCHLKFTGNALTRMGLIGNQKSQTTPVKNRKK